MNFRKLNSINGPLVQATMTAFEAMILSEMVKLAPLPKCSNSLKVDMWRIAEKAKQFIEGVEGVKK